MTLGQFLAIIRARWLLAAALLAVAVVVTAGVSLSMPKTYTATSSVVMDFKPDPVSAIAYGGMVPPAMVATQIDVLRSDRVAQRVVRNLKFADDPQVRAQWVEATGGRGTLEQWLAGVFQRQMEVLPARESSVISITYSAADPRFAAALANAFADAYIQTTLELRVDPARQYAGFFDVRAKEARETLEKAQARLSAFQREHGIIATDERLDIENARLNELSSQLVAVQSLTADSGSRYAQARGNQSDRMQEVLANPVIAGLKSDVNRAEARLKELTTRLGDANPQVVEARANIGELRARMDAETRRVTAGIGVSDTINRERETRIRAELDAQRAKMLQMKAMRDEGSVIVRDVENAQRTYDTIITRQNQSTLESQAPQSNVHLLTQAVAPLSPSSPRVLLNTVVAALAGALLAIGAVLVAELRDRRVRAPADVAVALGLPVIGLLPKPGSGRRQRQRNLAMSQRLLAVLPGRKGA
ncbi:chain length determinant protein EpsF [Rubrivivax gelatinosus]|uniref:Chain length determinant protein EpsF n=1 Tax=Rubrivivax gelatinosus TaxID=28068 RepID=A0ABS1DS17_RUBGE|nr:chain length determinant protein EpsF [Rubrivivax gelatinosus]MBK1616087.1 chain length determinant protein EpsF [Rubrivivax gelatinosus]MBK1712496.1 chain length determinant protein EpsF [Rubrivivax gelatinosus]